MCYSGANGIGDTVAFVAHHNESVAAKLLGVDVLAIEECAVDGVIRGQSIEQLIGLDIDYMYAGDAAHGGLNDLGIPGVDGAGAAEDGVDAEPIGDADDGAQVAGVLDVVEED